MCVCMNIHDYITKLWKVVRKKKAGRKYSFSVNDCTNGEAISGHPWNRNVFQFRMVIMSVTRCFIDAWHSLQVYELNEHCIDTIVTLHFAFQITMSFLKWLNSWREVTRRSFLFLRIPPFSPRPVNAHAGSSARTFHLILDIARCKFANYNLCIVFYLHYVM